MSEARASIRSWAVVAASLGGAAALHVMLRPALELVPFMLFHGANFVTVAAHELRTPLTTLRLRLQRLGARSGRSEDDLRAALRQVLRMDGLIHQFLDAIRLQQARIELDRRSVDLGALAREVGNRLAPS